MSAKPYLYTVYKTTNLINNKIYVGAHKTTNPDDSYLGSGVYLKRCIKKYGKENFKKEVLFIFETEKEALIKESEIVDENFVKSKETYNLKLGGGRKLGTSGYKFTEEQKKKMCISQQKRWSNLTDEERILIQEKRNRIPNKLKGKKLTKNHAKKISEALKSKNLLTHNSVKISINDEIFLSINRAAKELDIKPTTIVGRLKNKKYRKYFRIE